MLKYLVTFISPNPNKSRNDFKDINHFFSQNDRQKRNSHSMQIVDLRATRKLPKLIYAHSLRLYVNSQ